MDQFNTNPRHLGLSAVAIRVDLSDGRLPLANGRNNGYNWRLFVRINSSDELKSVASQEAFTINLSKWMNLKQPLMKNKNTYIPPRGRDDRMNEPLDRYVVLQDAANLLMKYASPLSEREVLECPDLLQLVFSPDNFKDGQDLLMEASKTPTLSILNQI